MTTTIYKYPLPITDQPIVYMPDSAQVRHVGEQGGELFIWAEVAEKDLSSMPHFFRIFGTGHDIKTEEPAALIWGHLATVIMSSGFVWHVFQMERIA